MKKSQEDINMYTKNNDYMNDVQFLKYGAQWTDGHSVWPQISATL